MVATCGVAVGQACWSVMVIKEGDMVLTEWLLRIKYFAKKENFLMTESMYS